MQRRTFIRAAILSPLAVLLYYKEGVAKPVIDAAAIAEAIKQTYNQISQLAHEVEMIVNQLTQISQLAKMLIKLPKTMMNTILKPFKDIMGAVNSLKGLGNEVQSIVKTFESVYNVDTFFNGEGGTLNWGTGTSGGLGIADKIKEWREQTEKQIKNIFELTPELQKSAESNLETVQQSLESSNDAEGILTAAQAGNEILATIAQQNQGLQTTLNQTNLLMASISAQQNSTQKAYPDVVKAFFGTKNSSGSN